jgi:O-antigen/teichoic acid export membrane protein
MAVTLALQMLLSLYTHVLWGLQQQVIFNGINASMIVLRIAGAAILLALVRTDLLSFFIWQALVTILHVAGLAWASWRLLPDDTAPKFNFSVLKKSRVFIAEVALATVLATLLMHIDKIVLSKLISLKEYGYYTLAWAMASVLGRIGSPIYSAWMPRLTQHVASGNAVLLKNTYLQGLKLLAVVIVPCALILSIFAEPILQTYTGNAELARAAMIALMLLSIGSALNSVLLMPHAVAMAHGWTRLSLIQNASACVVVVPLVHLATQRWGLNGAGLGWLLVNAVLFLITLPIIQKRCMVIPMTR